MNNGEHRFSFHATFTLLGGLLSGLVGFLYLLAIPITILSALPEKWFAFAIITLALGPIFAFGLYVYRRHTGVIELTDDALTIVRGSSRRSIRLAEITAVRERDRHVPPNMTFLAGSRSFRFSRKVEGFPYLYELLRARVPVMAANGPASLPLILDARRWYRMNLYGAVVLICALWLILGVFSFSTRPFDNPIEVASILAACAALMSLMAFFGFKPGKQQPVMIAFDTNEISLAFFSGKRRTVPLDAVREIRIYRTSRDIATDYLAARNIEYPLGITITDGTRYLVDEMCAKACRTTVERVLFALRDAYAGRGPVIENYRPSGGENPMRRVTSESKRNGHTHDS
ncbi:MAG TPA: hypothetical protein PKM65_06100 [Spirochaetota bacterium]|nr:hypothetical protein [Spirochaetota bacterium]HNT10072.1 hypothetical protein [Spirochaetota bacterium]